MRTVRDAALLLDAVCGPAPGDRYFVAGPVRLFVEALDADPGRLRVAIHTDPYWGRPTEAGGAFLDDYDLFVCPTSPAGPPDVGYPPQNDANYATAEAWIDEAFELIPFTPIANTTGQPSVSLPLGVAGDGLPIGAMLTAQALREGLLLSVAAQLEEAMPWAGRTPEVVAG